MTILLQKIASGQPQQMKTCICITSVCDGERFWCNNVYIGLFSLRLLCFVLYVIETLLVLSLVKLQARKVD